MKHYRILTVLAMVLMNGLTFADGDPTFHQVHQAAQAGRMSEAQGMMQKVLQDHPNSGKAHYVEAELLAKQGRLTEAETELNTAEHLSPGLVFAKPQAVQDLKARIAIVRQNQASVNGSSFSWGILLLGIASIGLTFFLFRAMSSRNSFSTPANAIPASPSGYPVGASGPMAQPYPGGMPNAPTGGGLGSNIVSGLVTGAAVGAGIVAGEALAHHFMSGNSTGSVHNALPVADSWGASSNDMGGNDFGIADNSSSWDDNSGVADNLGVGGEDWS